MQRHRTKLGRNHEQGVIITLVAVFMLFVVGAMAALSIDVVTIYTARSEAQLAADGAALAAARLIANSGATSDPTGAALTTVEGSAGPAKTIALQIAEQNHVGGQNLTAGEVAVNFGGTDTNPKVTVTVQKTNLPTFFARIWGLTTLTVRASATAEAYNPSGANAVGVPKIPVAPICVKPWLLPNMDPSQSGTIFSLPNGGITNAGLLGFTSATGMTRLRDACVGGDCSVVPLPTPTAWKYYPGDTATTFQPPTLALPACAPALSTPYEESVAGCIQTPIACNGTANIDTSDYGPARNTETRAAVNCLTHSTANEGDSVDPASIPPPFEFLAGEDNPVVLSGSLSAGTDIMVSDSLVTVPVFDSTVTPPTSPVTIIGFVQLFLNSDGDSNSPPNIGHVKTTIINMAGCGTSAAGQPILGNGASPVAVRLVSP